MSQSIKNEAKQKAFSNVVTAMQKDIPVLMHGSGDVEASSVNPESARLLAELTADYISKLVHAAIDAHEILNGGPQPLPPPPPARSQKMATPHPYEEPSPKDPKADVTKIPEPKYRKRRRATDEFWDEALPEPKVKNKPVKAKESKGYSFQGVDIDEWVGASGVDFFEANRARQAHVSLPAAIGTQSFIFPVCHDVNLYGKVLEVQAARRNLAPLLADPVLQEVVRNEATLQGPGALRKRDKKRSNTNAAELEDTDSETEEGGAEWPGLASLLPFHTTSDFVKFS